jgi:two-component system response regulator DegU
LREGSDGREVLNLLKTQRPDVVVMDIAMPGLNGLEAVERMTRDFPDVRIIILSIHNNEEYVVRALNAGVVGYLLKKAATAELETVLHEVMRGESNLNWEAK